MRRNLEPLAVVSNDLHFILSALLFLDRPQYPFSIHSAIHPFCFTSLPLSLENLPIFTLHLIT